MKCFKYILIILCSMFIGQSILFSQQHFNNLYNYEGIQEFSRDIHQLNNGNILNISGGGYPIYNYSGNIIRMLDENGNLLWEDYINLDTTHLFANWKHTSQIVNDSILITVATQQSGNFMYDWPYFLKYDLINQQLLDVKFYPSEFGSKIYTTKYHNDGYIYAAGKYYVDYDWIYWDVWLIKLDLDGNLIWEKTFDYDQRDAASEIESFGDNLLISGSYANLYDTLPSTTFIAKIDTGGNILSEVFPTYRGGSGMVETEIFEGDIYFGTLSDSIIIEYPTQYICKYDEDFNLVWENYIENTSEFEINYRSFEILNEQIIIVGNINEPQEYTNVPLFYTWSYASSLSLDGNFNWEHVYFYDSLNVHHLDDIIAAENGDLIFMGTVFTDPFDFTVPFSQNMWLFRTDANGCGIVQDTCYYTLDEYFGLDTVVSLLDNWDNLDNYVEVLGNPFSENLKFNIANSNFSKMHYEVLDLNGRIVHFNIAQNENVINTKHWQSGFYVLNVYKANKLIAQKKVLKI